ncbi:hypothetical protein [Bacillus sp. SLBN-46]|nr:hypothetical protein [Bacillus sp. SLBN-46]
MKPIYFDCPLYNALLNPAIIIVNDIKGNQIGIKLVLVIRLIM